MRMSRDGARSPARAVAFTLALAGAMGCSRTSPANRATTDSGTVDAVPPASAAAGGTKDSLRAVGAAPVALDTARGVVRRFGADPLSRLALVPLEGGGAELLALSGGPMPELAAAEGLEVMVAGTRTSERAMDVAPGGARVFDVRRFAVRASDGVAARDGVLVEVDGQPFLETAPGVREPITGLPSALRTQMGARVFLVGPAGRAPQAFGVLRAP